MRTTKAATALLLALGAMAAGCGPGGRGACDYDQFACDSGTSQFTIEENCELTGDLGLEIGQGETAWAALGEGEAPELIFGPQGGQHVVLAVRVSGVALERHEELMLSLRVKRGDGVIGSRSLILGRHHPLRRAEDDPTVVEEFGVVIIVDEVPQSDWSLEGTVRDPCNRVGHGEHLIPVGG